MDELERLIGRARDGDLEAYHDLVRATQEMAYAAAWGVLRDRALAEDATQEAYLKAFRRLNDLEEPSAFGGWFRRIVVTVALNMRRSRRYTLVCLNDIPDVPLLDEQETQWTDLQRHRLAGALLTLTKEERRLCDRRYHGGWSIARLADDAGIDGAAMRKRLQRVRDKLRKEIEVAERRNVPADDVGGELPAKVVELLARPELTDLPENPVGSILEQLRTFYSDFADIVVPEMIDFSEARKTIGEDALYIDPVELQRVDDRRVLRYDLTLPLLLSARYQQEPLRLWTAGKVYRICQTDATHLEAFHQAEVLWVDERTNLDPWRMTARVLQAVDGLFPGRDVKIVPTQYPMCVRAWELEIEMNGRWFELLAWGVYTDRILKHIGARPERDIAVGVGHGLERLAMLRYAIPDIRQIETARVA